MCAAEVPVKSGIANKIRRLVLSKKIFALCLLFVLQSVLLFGEVLKLEKTPLQMKCQREPRVFVCVSVM